MFINKTRMFAIMLGAASAMTPAPAVTGALEDPAPLQSLTEPAAFAGKGDGEETCPVTGETLANRRLKATFFGRDVHCCCEGCVRQALANPARYIKASLAEQRRALNDPATLAGQAQASPAEPAICE